MGTPRSKYGKAGSAGRKGGPLVLLFAYGRLQPGYSPPESLGKHEVDTIRGNLYDHERDPMATDIGSSSAGLIKGTTMELDENELWELDRVEVGYRRVPVITGAGRTAYVYEWQGKKPKAADRIEQWPKQG